MNATAYELLVRAVPALAPPLIRALFATCTVRILNRRVEDEYVRGGRSFVGAMWHKDFLCVLDYYRRRKIVVMVSRSRDGELVARTLHRMGYDTVRGSSSSGGGDALTSLVVRLRAGSSTALVVDGPKGPARIAKHGCVMAARESGVPIVPIGCHVEPSKRLRNWDGTMIPMPFARIVIAYAEPIKVPPDASREECERIRQRVDVAMAEAEAACRRAL